MNYFVSALQKAFLLIAPCALVTVLLAVVISILCFLLRTEAEKNENTPESYVPFSAVARLTIPFALFGFALGIFTGMVGQGLAGTIIGTVSTTAATYLAYLYAKDTPTSSRLPVVSALSAFFITIPLSVQYMTHYAAA